MKQFTKQQAIDFYDGGIWEAMSYRQRAELQIQQTRLCMPFDIFHEAVQKTTGRPVFTHEFGMSTALDQLKAEIFDNAEPPSLEEIINLIPEEKRIVILAEDA